MFAFATVLLVIGIILVVKRVNVGLASFVLSLSATTIVYYFLGGIKKDTKVTIKNMPFYGAAALIVSLTVVPSYIIGSSYSSDSFLSLAESNGRTFYEAIHPSLDIFGFRLGEICVGRLEEDEIASRGFLNRTALIRELDSLNGKIAFLHKDSKRLSGLEIEALDYEFIVPKDILDWLLGVNLTMDVEEDRYHPTRYTMSLMPLSR